MIKHQSFVNKHLPVQIQRNKHLQKIFDLFKLICPGVLNKNMIRRFIIVANKQLEKEKEKRGM